MTLYAFFRRPCEGMDPLNTIMYDLSSDNHVSRGSIEVFIAIYKQKSELDSSFKKVNSYNFWLVK